MKTYYSTAEVQAMTGIQVTGNYNYELRELSLEDINMAGFDKPTVDMYGRGGTVIGMVAHLEMGGTLPPIILYPREVGKKLSIADGCHRISAYILTKTQKFFGLIKIPI